MRYDAPQEAAIREAYMAGVYSVDINVECEEQGSVVVYTYTIDLTPGAMSQTALHTGFRRTVQMRTQETEEES